MLALCIIPAPASDGDATAWLRVARAHEAENREMPMRWGGAANQWLRLARRASWLKAVPMVALGLPCRGSPRKFTVIGFWRLLKNAARHSEPLFARGTICPRAHCAMNLSFPGVFAKRQRIRNAPFTGTASDPSIHPSIHQ